MQEPSDSILAIIAGFWSLGLTINHRRSAVVLMRIAHSPSELAFTVKYVGVREVAKPIQGLNDEECVRKIWPEEENGNPLPQQACSYQRTFASRLFLPTRLHRLGLIDPSCAMHKMLKETLVLVESSDDFVVDAMMLMRAASSFARSGYSFEPRARRCIASLERKILVDIHPILSGTYRLDAVKLIHA
ncbi:hypothetical protein RF11_14372 [Thelohanellus kitauei]|uniref:Uncharacterized protein n=1 Tax=Thelohanellus kitauei TaxID=669202 RepID=A0A0C2J818_THEKT|nr:hypothetical protein RF11_14372 [Thelohanellus kitauei]